MIVAIHSAPQGFFKTDPPYSNSEIISLMEKVASIGFKAVQVGPLRDYVSIEGRMLKSVLDNLNLSRSVHTGGIYNAADFALTEEGYSEVQREIHYGIMLSTQISSKLVSIHPPFFFEEDEANETLMLRARRRFLKLLNEETHFASTHNVTLALESFCYKPFIFDGLNDYVQFVMKFPSEKLGFLIDIGHLYQIGIDLNDAVAMFKHRLLDIHIHDATREKEYQKATHLPIGKGTINFPELTNLLKEAKYDKWLTLEIRGNEKEILESKKHLEKLIAIQKAQEEEKSYRD